MIYFELFNELADFSDAECGQLFRDMLNYGITGEVPDYSDRAMRTIWKGLQRRIDADGERYEAQRQQRTAAINKRWEKYRTEKDIRANTDEYERIRNIPTTTTTTTPTPTTTPTTSPTNNISADKPQKRTRFVKPTLEEVAAYCRERRNNIDPQGFIDHYESNGWKVGKTPMQDWKAAVRTWERNGKSGGKATQPINSPDKYQYGKERAL